MKPALEQITGVPIVATEWIRPVCAPPPMSLRLCLWIAYGRFRDAVWLGSREIRRALGHSHWWHGWWLP